MEGMAQRKDAELNKTKEAREKRIAVRRTRLETRLDRARYNVKEGGKNENKEKKSVDANRATLDKYVAALRDKIEESRKYLEAREASGWQVITNIQAAADSRELERSEREADNRRNRMEEVKKESLAAARQFKSIQAEWKKSAAVSEAHELQDVIEEQGRRCDELLKEKDNLIHELEQDLKNVDEEYVMELKEEREEVDLLLDRVRHHLLILRGEYDKEADDLEKRFIAERGKLLEECGMRWEETAEYRRKQEKEAYTQHHYRVDMEEKEMEDHRNRNMEEYDVLKIELETEYQQLELKCQQLEAAYQLNQERLDYNYQILTRREEESKATINIQKKRLNKLHDTLNRLHGTYNNRQHDYDDENMSLTDDYDRISKNMRELQERWRSLMDQDRTKFSRIWHMNEEECKKLLMEIEARDKVIREHILGLSWGEKDRRLYNKPSLRRMRSVLKSGRSTAPLSRSRSATQYVTNITRHLSVDVKGDEEYDLARGVTEQSTEDDEQGEVIVTGSEGIGRPLAEVAVELTGRLEGLVAPDNTEVIPAIPQVPPVSQNTETQDAGVIKPSGLTSGGDQGLEETQDGIRSGDSKIREELLKKVMDLVCDSSGFLIEKKLITALKPLEEREKGLIKMDAIFNVLGVETEEDVEKLLSYLIKYMPNETDNIYIEDALKAIGEFLTEGRRDSHIASISRGSKAPQSARQSMISELSSGIRQRFSISEGGDSLPDMSSWSNLIQAIPADRQHLWQGLATALEKYHLILKKRCNLSNDNEKMRKENVRMRLLIEEYVNSKTNANYLVWPLQPLQDTMKEVLGRS